MAEAYPEHGSPSRYTIERGRRRKETVLVDNVENQIWHRNGKKGKLVFRCLKKPSLHCKATLKYRNGRYVRTGNGHNHDSLELEISTNRMLHFGHNLAQTSSTPVGEIIRLSFERWKFSILVCKEFICVIIKNSIRFPDAIGGIGDASFRRSINKARKEAQPGHPRNIGEVDALVRQHELFR